MSLGLLATQVELMMGGLARPGSANLVAGPAMEVLRAPIVTGTSVGALMDFHGHSSGRAQSNQ